MKIRIHNIQGVSNKDCRIINNNELATASNCNIDKGYIEPIYDMNTKLEKWSVNTKKFHFLESTNWSWIKLLFGGSSNNENTAIVYFYVDSELEFNNEILTFEVNGNRPLRLPSLKEGFEWQFKIVSDGILLDFQLVNLYEELICDHN